MPRKPTLTVVNSATASGPPPPASLGESGRRLWQQLHSDYVIEDASGLEMLTQICAAADTVSLCEAEIAQDGPTIRTKAGLKDHPLLKHQLAARSFIVRSLHRLGFDIEPPRASVGRPPGTYIKARGP